MFEGLGYNVAARERCGRREADTVVSIGCQQAHALALQDEAEVRRYTFPPAVVRAQYEEVKYCARVICSLATGYVSGGETAGFGFGSPVPDGDGFAVHVERFVSVFACNEFPDADTTQNRVTDTALREAILLRLPIFVGVLDGQQLPSTGDVRIRLLAVDAHEMSGPNSDDAICARDFLRSWLEDSRHAKLVLDVFSMDHYGRFLAVVRAAAHSFKLEDVQALVDGKFVLLERFSRLLPRLLDLGHVTTVPHILQVQELQKCQFAATRPFPGPTPLETRVAQQNSDHDKVVAGVAHLVAQLALGPKSKILDFHTSIRKSSTVVDAHHVYNQYFSLLPEPFCYIRPRFCHNGSEMGLYVTPPPHLESVEFKEELWLDVPDQSQFNPSAATHASWLVEDDRRGEEGRLSRYSDPYKCFSPGMLLNERSTLDDDGLVVVHTSRLQAAFARVTEGELHRHVKRTVAAKFVGLLVPENYAGSRLPTGVIKINPGTYNADTELRTYYGRHYERRGYAAPPTHPPPPHSIPPLQPQDMEYVSQQTASHSLGDDTPPDL